MAQEDLVSDLEVLDFLELFNSTVLCGQMIGLSQSACSRRYRTFSRRFNLGFDRVSGRYQAAQNHDVLQSLREASQKLRVRQGRMRIAYGWQLGAINRSALSELGQEIQLTPMNSWTLLSMLEQRLIDVAVMGLMEFQGLLGTPLSRLRARRLPLSVSMLCVPLCCWDLRLIAHLRHPLQGRRDIDADDLAQFPSPTLPIGMAPTLVGALQSQGLGTQNCGLLEYDESQWEGKASDGISLSYGAAHRIIHLDRRYEAVPLDYKLGIDECIGIVGHRDILSDPAFATFISKLLAGLRNAIGMHCSDVRWLI